MVSMRDIAEKCSVSVATVSKALNNHSDISEETRKKIRQTASDMGYYPNSAARALKTNRSYNIGVLMNDRAHSGLTHEYFSAVLEGVKVESESRGYDITFINTHNRKMTYYEHCKYRNLDGVVIACADFEEPEVQEVVNGAIPSVTIDYIFNNCTSVSSDNVKGMRELVQYVYKMGHRKIAYIHGESNSEVTKERLASFYMTLEELDVDVPDENIVKRMGGRRACVGCGATYHLVYAAPKKDGICDVCGGELILRDDDKPETVEKRLHVYHDQTQPLIDYYTKAGILKSVDGTVDMEDVFGAIVSILGE